MAIVLVSTFLIEEWLFKGLNVEIRDARMSLGGDALEMSILGDDVPDCAEAILICYSSREPGSDPYNRIEIKAVEPRVNQDKKAVGVFIADYGKPV